MGHVTLSQAAGAVKEDGQCEECLLEDPRRYWSSGGVQVLSGLFLGLGMTSRL